MTRRGATIPSSLKFRSRRICIQRQFFNFYIIHRLIKLVNRFFQVLQPSIHRMHSEMQMLMPMDVLVLMLTVIILVMQTSRLIGHLWIIGSRRFSNYNESMSSKGDQQYLLDKGCLLKSCAPFNSVHAPTFGCVLDCLNMLTCMSICGSS